MQSADPQTVKGGIYICIVIFRSCQAKRHILLAGQMRKQVVGLGIGGLQSRLPDEISGGQQQRVALARAMLRNRPILLLDESFSALDWSTREGCFDALRDLATTRQMAVLIVSHDERDAAYLGCDVMRLEA